MTFDPGLHADPSHPDPERPTEDLAGELRHDADEARDRVGTFAQDLGPILSSLSWVNVVASGLLDNPRITEASTSPIRLAAEGYSTDTPSLRLNNMTGALEATLSRMGADADLAGANARAQFAASVLGVAAEKPAEISSFADAVLEGLRERLAGVNREGSELSVTLQQVADKWKDMTESEFWESLAVTLRTTARGGETVRPRQLLDQVLWMGIVGELSGPQLATWIWESPDQKAAFVDQLIQAAGRPPDPAKMYEKAATLMSDSETLPRAITADLAQLALAALLTEPPQRRSTLTVLSTPDPKPLTIGMSPEAARVALGDYGARENLRGSGLALFGEAPTGAADPFVLDLSQFRYDLSEAFTYLAQRTVESLTRAGEKQRAADLANFLAGTRLASEFEAWSAKRRKPGTDWQDLAEASRSLQKAVADFFTEFRSRYDTNDLQKALELSVEREVRRMAEEAGRETADLLDGQGDSGNPMDGLRESLAFTRQAAALLHLARRRASTALLNRMIKDVGAHVGYADRIRADADWVTNLGTAADSLMRELRRKEGIDIEDLQAAVFAFSRQMTQARAREVAESARWTVDCALNALCEAVLEQLQDTADARPGIDVDLDILTQRIRQDLSRPRGLPDADSLGRFWSEQKDSVIGSLPPDEAKALTKRMDLDFSASLKEFVRMVESRQDPSKIKSAGWGLAQTVVAYRKAVSEIVKAPIDKAKLYDALDKISLQLDDMLAGIDGTAPRPM